MKKKSKNTVHPTEALRIRTSRKQLPNKVKNPTFTKTTAKNMKIIIIRKSKSKMISKESYQLWKMTSSKLKKG